jgi:hypothetical protein
VDLELALCAGSSQFPWRKTPVELLCLGKEGTMGADRTLMHVKVRCGLGRVGCLHGLGELPWDVRSGSKSSMRANVFCSSLNNGRQGHDFCQPCAHRVVL